MIEAKIIADSENVSSENRVTTFLLRYPRFIHAEFMTHRMFSRNASSSRAIPVSKLIEEARFAPAMPIFWGKNQKGMQSFEELEEPNKSSVIALWNATRLNACHVAEQLNTLNLHKQYLNRILEPYTHITIVCTATEYGNFFNLRAHKDAMPEIQELAFQMLELYTNNEPKKLQLGEWHLPFCDKYINDLSIEQLLKVCVARCARVSYLNFEGDISYAKDEELFDRLKSSGHWSPFEHACKASTLDSGNFKGFTQYRKLFEKENKVCFDSKNLLEQRKAK